MNPKLNFEPSPVAVPPPSAGSQICQVAMPHPAPPEIAVCPECGGELIWQVTTDDGLNDLTLDCENEPDIEDEEAVPHRGWQSDWQPVIDRIKAWIHSANVEVRDGGGEA